MNAHATNAEIYTFPWGNPREAQPNPQARSKAGLEHSTVAAVLAESDISLDKCGFDGRKPGGSQVLLSQQFVHRTGGYGGEEHAFGVGPSVAVGGSGADEHRARRAERNQLVRIHRHIARVQRSGVLQEIAGHPMVFIGRGDVLHRFSKIAAVQLQAALAGRADEGDGESLVVGHGDRGSFTVTGVAFDADAFGIHRFVSFEII